MNQLVQIQVPEEKILCKYCKQLFPRKEMRDKKNKCKGCDSEYHRQRYQNKKLNSLPSTPSGMSTPSESFASSKLPSPRKEEFQRRDDDFAEVLKNAMRRIKTEDLTDEEEENPTTYKLSHAPIFSKIFETLDELRVDRFHSYNEKEELSSIIRSLKHNITIISKKQQESDLRIGNMISENKRLSEEVVNLKIQILRIEDKFEFLNKFVRDLSDLKN